MHLFSERCKLSCRGLWNENPMIWPDLWCACLIMPGGPHIVYKVNVFAVQMHCLHDEEEVHPPHIQRSTSVTADRDEERNVNESCPLAPH